MPIITYPKSDSDTQAKTTALIIHNTTLFHITYMVTSHKRMHAVCYCKCVSALQSGECKYGIGLHGKKHSCDITTDVWVK